MSAVPRDPARAKTENVELKQARLFLSLTPEECARDLLSPEELHGLRRLVRILAHWGQLPPLGWLARVADDGGARAGKIRPARNGFIVWR